MKYKGQEEIGGFLGDWFGHMIQENNHLTGVDYVIPVPLHKKKLRKRGYNQTALFAKRLAFHLNSTYSDEVLIKTANTRTQTKKTRLGRWYDNRSLYEITNEDRLINKKILLVDDVITTGATMELCATVIKNVPGTTVYIASMAVVP